MSEEERYQRFVVQVRRLDPDATWQPGEEVQVSTILALSYEAAVATGAAQFGVDPSQIEAVAV